MAGTGECSPVGGYCLIAVAARLQRMTARGQGNGVPWHPLKDRRKTCQSGRVISCLQALDRVQGLKLNVFGVLPAQPRSLLPRSRETLPSAKHADIIHARGNVSRRKHCRALKKELRLLQRPQTQPDLRQQTHAFDIPGRLLQKPTAQALCLQQTSPGEQVGNGNEGSWKSLQMIELRTNPCGGFAVTSGFEDGELAAEAGSQRGVGSAGSRIGAQSTVPITPITTEVPALLQGVAMLGVVAENTVQARFRLRAITLKPITDRGQIEPMAICLRRIRSKKCKRAREIPGAHA